MILINSEDWDRRLAHLSSLIFFNAVSHTHCTKASLLSACNIKTHSHPGPLHLLCLLPRMVFLLPSGSWLLLVTVGLAYIGSHACSPSRPDKSTLLQVFWNILFLPPFVLDHLGITLFGFATWKYLCAVVFPTASQSASSRMKDPCVRVCSVTSVVSDSLRPYGL